MNLLGVGLVYAGLLTALAGAVSLLKPLAFAGIQTRGQGLAVLACSLVLMAAGGLLPARTRRASGAPGTATRLDEFVPAWQFGELHRVAVHAPRQQVYQAIKAVTADEILFFRAAGAASPRVAAPRAAAPAAGPRHTVTPGLSPPRAAAARPAGRPAGWQPAAP